MKKLLVDVSDLHCGSVEGLAPPITQTEHGNVIGFGKNIHQEWLWQTWQEMCSRVKEIIGDTPKKYVSLIVNGDATEGVHHKNESEITVALIETHTNMASECLKPLKQMASEVFVVKGTECHTKNMENKLAEKLGAVGGMAKDKWHIRINGCLIDAAHHMMRDRPGVSGGIGNVNPYGQCAHQLSAQPAGGASGVSARSPALRRRVQ